MNELQKRVLWVWIGAHFPVPSLGAVVRAVSITHFLRKLTNKII